MLLCVGEVVVYMSRVIGFGCDKLGEEDAMWGSEGVR